MRSNSCLLVMVLAVLATASSGCATSIEKKFAATRFHSPETRGMQLKGELDVGLQSGNEVEIVNNINNSPPPVNAPDFKRTDFDFVGAGAVSLQDWLDIELRIQADGPTTLGFKLQPIGASAEQAKQGNFSVGLNSAAGYASEDGESVGLFGSPTVSYDTDIWTIDFGLVTGYRVHDQVVVYTGPFYQRGFVSGSITSPALTSNVFGFSGRLSQWGWNLGTQLDFGSIVFKLDGSWAQADYNAAAISGFHGGFMVGGKF